MGGLPGITIPLVVYANGTLELKLGRDFDIHSILLLGKNPTKKSESWFRVAMASQLFELNLKSEIGGWASRESTLHLEEEKYFQSNILGIPHVLGFTESESSLYMYHTLHPFSSNPFIDRVSVFAKIGIY